MLWKQANHLENTLSCYNQQMQTLSYPQDSSALTQDAHFMTSPRVNNFTSESGQDGPEPFRQINIEHIQNSSNGKHLGNFRSPMNLRKNQSNQGANSQNSKNAGESASKVNLSAVQRFNTDLKIPMRIKGAAEQHTGPDENTILHRHDVQQLANSAYRPTSFANFTE